MKTITALGAAALFATLSAVSTPAFAERDARERREDRREFREERREDRREFREERREYREDRREDRRDYREDRRDDRHDAIARSHRDYRHDGRRDYRYDSRRDYGYYDRGPSHRYYATRTYRPAYVYVAPRGYRVSRWNVGHRMPPPFYARPYYIDPMHYHLRMPPRGYRWVRVDRDVYLVSIASGLIADVLYGIFR